MYLKSTLLTTWAHLELKSIKDFTECLVQAIYSFSRSKIAPANPRAQFSCLGQAKPFTWFHVKRYQFYLSFFVACERKICRQCLYLYSNLPQSLIVEITKFHASWWWFVWPMDTHIAQTKQFSTQAYWLSFPSIFTWTH